MADPTEFIHPIIQAMLASAENDRKLAQQKETNRSNQADEAARQQQIDQVKQSHIDDYGLAKQRLDAEVSHLQSQMDMEHVSKLKDLSDLVSSGAVKPQEVQGALGVQTFPGVQGGYAAGTFQTPEEHLQSLAKQTGAITTAQEAAKQPFEQAARDDQYDKAVKVANIGASGREDVARIADESRQYKAKLDNDYRNQVLDMKIQALKNGNATPDEAANLYHDVYISGTTKYGTLNKQQRASVDAIVPKNHTPIDPKDNEAFDNIPSVQNIFNTASQLSGYSFKPGSGNMLETLQGHLGIGGEQKALADALKTDVERLIPIYTKVTRASGAEIRQQFEGLYSPYNSPKENAEKIAKAESFFDSIIQPVLAKYPKDQATQILSNRNIVYKGYTIPGTDSSAQTTPALTSQGTGKTKPAIELPDGTRISDTPANRLKHGIPQ